MAVEYTRLRSFRGADCDIDLYLAVVKFVEIWLILKKAAQKLDEERFNVWKLNEMKVKKQYQIEITNRCAALENLSDGEDINRSWENIKGNIKTSGKESRCVQIEAA
jgi:hypothetical protein